MSMCKTQIALIINKHKCTCWADFYRCTTPSEYSELLDNLYFNLKTVVEIELSRYRKGRLYTEKQNRWAILTAEPRDEYGIEFFNNMFNINKISIPLFIKSLYVIMQNMSFRKNTIMFHGCKNSGKSLLSSCLTSRFMHCKKTNSGSLGDFFFSNLLFNSVHLFEELQLTPSNSDDFKDIVGKGQLDVNVKHCVDHQRTSDDTCNVATTQYDSFGRGFIAKDDEDALLDRCFIFHINKCYRSENIMLKITADHLAAFLYNNRQYIENIEEFIKKHGI